MVRGHPGGREGPDHVGDPAVGPGVGAGQHRHARLRGLGAQPSVHRGPAEVPALACGVGASADLVESVVEHRQRRGQRHARGRPCRGAARDRDTCRARASRPRPRRPRTRRRPAGSARPPTAWTASTTARSTHWGRASSSGAQSAMSLAHPVTAACAVATPRKSSRSARRPQPSKNCPCWAIHGPAWTARQALPRPGPGKPGRRAGRRQATPVPRSGGRPGRSGTSRPDPVRHRDDDEQRRDQGDRRQEVRGPDRRRRT